jgi:hypothetical protein
MGTRGIGTNCTQQRRAAAANLYIGGVAWGRSTPDSGWVAAALRFVRDFSKLVSGGCEGEGFTEIS